MNCLKEGFDIYQLFYIMSAIAVTALAGVVVQTLRFDSYRWKEYQRKGKSNSGGSINEL